MKRLKIMSPPYALTLASVVGVVGRLFPYFSPSSCSPGEKLEEGEGAILETKINLSLLLVSNLDNLPPFPILSCWAANVHVMSLANIFDVLQVLNNAICIIEAPLKRKGIVHCC